MGWTVILAILLLAGQSVLCLGLDHDYSDVAVGLAVSPATVMGWTFIIAMLLLAGHSVQQQFLAGQLLHRCCCGLGSQYS